MDGVLELLMRSAAEKVGPSVDAGVADPVGE